MVPENVLFEAVCNEGTKSEPKYVVRQARPMVLGGEDIVKLWFKLSKFPILFASPQETSFKNFVAMLQDEFTVLISIDDIGMFLVTDIVPGTEARVHISFWDSRLSGREPLVREFAKWVFDTMKVRRVAAPIRADARAMRAFVERAGLYFEGALKNWIYRPDGKHFDLYLYGITRDEADPHWVDGRSWAKPRVRLLEIYETK